MSRSGADGTLSASCRRFSLAEIRSATRDFNDEHLIGSGGFGKVYKGKIDDGQLTVAMKRRRQNSNQGEGEFLTEIKTLSKLRHVNLVSLIGYCNENGEMILVYDYIPNGTLSDHLYCSSLMWKQLLNICIGAARGIDYLHTGTSVIHRDVKSTNILVHLNFTPKVSDFGLAKHFSPTTSKTHVSTEPKGTFGYIDTSYFATGRLTKNSDTYSFGAVLLEALTGQKATDTRLDDMGMVNWAKDKIRAGRADQIVASNLRDQISKDCLKTFVGIAEKCLCPKPKRRPPMAQVVAQLELALQQQELKATRPRFPSFLSCYKISGNDNTPSSNAIPIHKLRDITNNFSPDRIIREAYGQCVYYGEKSGQEAEIIMINRSFQTEAEFVAQVATVSSLKHENVAQPLGYCVDGDRRFIAYEFAVNGPLNEFLQGDAVNYLHRPQLDLSWNQRVKIAMGVAKGLVCIHMKSQIHCNFGPNSVLVYGDNVAKLAYFYHPTRSTFDNVEDYAAYLPPEGDLSWRSDVYGFGIILLQLVTGRTPSEIRRPHEHTNIMDWVKRSVDARLHGDYPEEKVAKVVKIAVLCLKEAETRPRMIGVVQALRTLLND